MASRSLNKVTLIGNLTKDPELKYIQQGNAVCTFGLATNRSWLPSEGSERREETEYHRLVAWGKLAELCSQLLTKGRKVYIEGRLQTRSWETPEGQQRSITEIVVEDMILLDNKRPATGEAAVAAPVADDMQDDVTPVEPKVKEVKADKEQKEPMDDKINIDDIPF
jgi:single-strand DNA-binding protein